MKPDIYIETVMRWALFLLVIGAIGFSPPDNDSSHLIDYPLKRRLDINFIMPTQSSFPSKSSTKSSKFSVSAQYSQLVTPSTTSTRSM